MGSPRTTPTRAGNNGAPPLDDVKATLRGLIEENAGIPAGTIEDGSTIDGDLAMDSMSFVSLQVAVEETFGVRCDPEDLEARNRFDAIAAFIHEQLREGNATAAAALARSRARPSRAKHGAGGKSRPKTAGRTKRGATAKS